jgi:alpha-galactosidase
MTSLALALLVSAAPAQEPPVRVFILAGQSNMVGHGFIAANPERNGGKGSLEYVVSAPGAPPLYRRLKDSDGEWRVRDDVFIDYFDRKGNLTVGYGAGKDTIGPELGFGHVVGDALEEPVLLIKLAWGGRSLAVDFRPPSSGDTVGPTYTEMIRGAKKAMADAETNFPQWKGRRFVISGFGWHQGWNDRINGDYVAEYQTNMANFIGDVRRDLKAIGMPFVIAETGMGGREETNERALALMKAQAAVAEQPEFEGNVAFVGTRGFWRSPDQSPSDQGYHWNQNGETYFLIGDAMGRAMVKLMDEAAR